jgi:metallo-beta-lactamase class B
MLLARVLALAIVPFVSVAPGRAGDSAVPPHWTRPFEPFRIVDTVHYVGTEGLSAFLVTGPEGHVLIDGGLPESAPQIAASIRKLGFDPADVRYLLVNHAHFDHAGGLAALKTLTGARLVASAGDAPSLEAGGTVGRPELGSFPAVKVDRVIANGDTLVLGPIRMTARLTPGHTPGCTSWTIRAGGIRAGGRDVLFACSLTVAGQKLVGDTAYPTAAADFRATFATLGAVKADVFLNFHPEFFGMAGKRARQPAGAADAFVDPAELPRQVKTAKVAFEAELEAQRAKAPVR